MRGLGSQRACRQPWWGVESAEGPWSWLARERPGPSEKTDPACRDRVCAGSWLGDSVWGWFPSQDG